MEAEVEAEVEAAVSLSLFSNGVAATEPFVIAAKNPKFIKLYTNAAPPGSRVRPTDLQG